MDIHRSQRLVHRTPQLRTLWDHLTHSQRPFHRFHSSPHSHGRPTLVTTTSLPATSKLYDSKLFRSPEKLAHFDHYGSNRSSNGVPTMTGNFSRADRANQPRGIGLSAPYLTRATFVPHDNDSSVGAYRDSRKPTQDKKLLKQIISN